ncbi:hypothetical protein, partial [Clavibacter michiganensis]|uniref:hypothetical protein n=1 Tax=Clavibacter michiganensis TaxID=28447 RepID=UPI00292D9A38
MSDRNAAHARPRRRPARLARPAGGRPQPGSRGGRDVVAQLQQDPPRRVHEHHLAALAHAVAVASGPSMVCAVIA